ncbi:MAG: hypothetical protein NVSMB25_19940 [Thermoleophilaceae bacterium]
MGLKIGLDGEAGVQEIRLVRELALRLGLVDRGGRDHHEIPALELGTSGPQVCEPVAEVRPEPEICPRSNRLPCQPRSFQTSTDTSSTGRASGGSGFVARTVTVSAE